MKKTKKKLLTFALACVIGATCALGLLGCSTNPEQELGDVGGISLYTSEIATVYNENGTITKEIPYGVEPDYIPDKSVSVSVNWLDNQIGESALVSDYITAELNEAQFKIYVTAHQAFAGSTILLTVQTIVGGYRDSCIISYEGIPETTLFSYAGNDLESGSQLSLDISNQYHIELKPTNTFNVVTSKYTYYEIQNIELVGDFIISLSGNYSGSMGSYSELRKISFSEFMPCLNEYIDINLAVNILMLDVKRSVESFVGYAQSRVLEGLENPEDVSATLASNSPTLTPENYSSNLFEGANYAQYESGAENCFVRIYVKEKITGIVSYIDIQIRSTVTSVKLGNDTLVF